MQQPEQLAASQAEFAFTWPCILITPKLFLWTLCAAKVLYLFHGEVKICC